MHQPIRDVAVVRYQPLDLENYNNYDFSRYGCYTFTKEIDHPIYFDKAVTYLSQDEKRQDVPEEFTCGVIKEYY